MLIPVQTSVEVHKGILNVMGSELATCYVLTLESCDWHIFLSAFGPTYLGNMKEKAVSFNHCQQI